MDSFSRHLPSLSKDLVKPSSDSNPISLYNQEISELRAKFAVPIMADSIWPSLMALYASCITSKPFNQLLSYAQLGPEYLIKLIKF